MTDALALRLSSNVPALATAAGERAGMRFLEFFAANIRNPHTRRGYCRAADEFPGWCSEETRGARRALRDPIIT